MNYYRARQRMRSGLWDWTFKNGKIVAPHGSCTKECKHKTENEAKLHLARWLRDQNLNETESDVPIDNEVDCQVKGCKFKTNDRRSSGIGSYRQSYTFCATHKIDPPVDEFSHHEIISSY